MQEQVQEHANAGASVGAGAGSGSGSVAAVGTAVGDGRQTAIIKGSWARFFGAKRRTDIVLVDDEDEDEEEEGTRTRKRGKAEDSDDNDNTVIQDSAALSSLLPPKVGRKGDDTVHDVD